MGARIVKGLPATQELHGKQTLGNSTRPRSTTIAICGSLRPCSQWGTCSGERTRVESHSTTYLLHLGSLVRSKAELYRDRKIADAILTSSRKLKHYFQAHEITVPSSQPLGDILSNKEASRRIEKWATELGNVLGANQPICANLKTTNQDH